MASPINMEHRRLFSLSDSIDLEDYIIINYRITPREGHQITDVAAEIALISSIGTLKKLSYENDLIRHRNCALIIDANEPGSDGSSFVNIAYPMQLFSGNDGITQLLGVSTFSSEYKYSAEFRIEGFRMPNNFINRFDGPQFGVKGIKQVFDYPDRPLFGAILKPRMGITLEVLVHIAEEALTGGADFIVDDELLTDQAGELSFDSRVPALCKMADKVSKLTKSPKVYIPNITSTPIRCMNYGKKAVEYGAKIVLVNGYTMGLAGLQDVCEYAELSIPIITCNIGNAIVSRNKTASGMSSATISRLSRLAGADAVHAGISSAEWFSNEAWGPSITSLSCKLGKLQPSMPVAAGGFSIANTWDNVRDLGVDSMLEAGSGVFASFGGPRDACKGIRILLEELTPEMNDEEAKKTIQDLAKKYNHIKADLNQFGYDHNRGNNR